MSNFKPQLTVITQDSNRDYRNDHYRYKSPYKTIQYKTYRELVKNIKQHLIDNLEATISVCRSKRGNWGEWYEHWILANGKAVIIKSGWM